MQKYPASHWKALGEYIQAGRLQSGYTDMQKWSEAVGRSTRILLGLERGEAVGPKTIEAISEVLGVPNWSLFSVLDKGERPDWMGSSDDDVEHAREVYERETGLEADAHREASLLYMLTDQELLEELGKRLATRPVDRSERRLREAQAAWSDDDNADLSDPDDEIPAAAKEGVIEEPGEFNT